MTICHCEISSLLKRGSRWLVAINDKGWVKTWAWECRVLVYLFSAFPRIVGITYIQLEIGYSPASSYYNGLQWCVFALCHHSKWMLETLQTTNDTLATHSQLWVLRMDPAISQSLQYGNWSLRIKWISCFCLHSKIWFEMVLLRIGDDSVDSDGPTLTINRPLLTNEYSFGRDGKLLFANTCPQKSVICESHIYNSLLTTFMIRLENLFSWS